MANIIYNCGANGWFVLPLELGIVLFEFGLLGLTAQYGKRLLYSVFLTNLISFLTGIFLFGFS